MTLRTVTLNTGFDEVVTVRDVIFGGVAEIVGRSIYASGKGVNTARLLRTLGHDVVAYGLIGTGEHRAFSALLGQAGIGDRLVPVSEVTRRNLTLLPQAAGRPAAHLKAEGFTRAGQRDVNDLLALLKGDVRRGDIVSLHGSVPSGVAPGVWREFAGAARAAGAEVVVDVHGPALALALDGSVIRACKPNEQELAGLPEVGRAQTSGRELAALRSMSARGVQLPVVSMEGRGAAFLADETVRRIWRPAAKVRMLVGAGDAFMAGLLSALASGASAAAALTTATACASLHVEGLESQEIARHLPDALSEVQIAEM